MNAVVAAASWSEVQEHTIRNHEGTELFYRRWGGGHARRALLMLHRGHEHSGRLSHLPAELSLDSYAVYAMDARGHGESGGATAQSVAELVRDLDCFARHVTEVDGIAQDDMVVLAHSMGAVVAATWVHDYAPRIRGMVLAAPAFDVDLRVPLAEKALRLARTVGVVPTVRSRVTPGELSHDKDRQQSYQTDPLINLDISTDLLLDLSTTTKRIVADAPAITVPTQLLLPGADTVVRPDTAHLFMNTIGSQRRETHVFPDLRHDVLGERDRGPVIAAIRGFVTHCFESPVEVPDLTSADMSGFTHDEAKVLRQPLSPVSAKGLYWRGMRASIRLGAFVSRGVAIGVETGFDSGTTLDYVYRNRPEGAGPLGRLVDRAYLDAVGWRGIRQRKVHLEEMIAEVMARLRADAAPAHVVDIAAGHGRYVLDALANAEQPESILLRDYCERNVASGRKLIDDRELGHVAHFETGDAFDRASLASLSPRPTLAIVSGLYELFPENAPVSRSLSGLADAVPQGGYLIYTGQPWHPQLEQIARTLTSHRGGDAWVMRRRTQQEMDQLVHAAGFEKLEQRIDRWGIFTVSLARRMG